MRNNVKVVAPAIAQGLGIIPNGLFLALDAPFQDIVLKKNVNGEINILGKGKTAIDKTWVKKVVQTFCNKEGITSNDYEINITSKIPTHFPFYHQVSITAGLLVALTTAYRKGHYEMEIYKMYKHLFDDSNDLGAFYTCLSGGMVTGLPKEDIFQKVYTPNGLSLLIIESPSPIEETNTALAANTVLAFANTNFPKLEMTLGKYNTKHPLYNLLKKHGGYGLLTIDEKSKLAIFKNTVSTEDFIDEVADTKHIITRISTEGILGM